MDWPGIIRLLKNKMMNVGKGSPGQPDHGWSLFIVSVVMTIVSGLFVTLRIAIRLSRRIMGIDDYLILLVRARSCSIFDMKDADFPK